MSGALVPVLFVIALTACSGAAGPSHTPGPTDSGQPSPSPTNDANAIDHLTGPTDVIFRFEEGGGFVPMGFFATQAPQFTLYGDGTVIFRDNSAPPPQPIGNLNPLTPYSIARMSEADIQAFLRFALADSGLGVAREFYRPGNVADIPTATFTVNAGGLTKTVGVEGLGFEDPQNPDAPILKALAGLGDKVRNFGPLVDGEKTWMPDRYRGVLTEGGQAGGQSWPWTDLTVADFVLRPEQDAPQFPIHTLTPAQVAALGLTGIDGGFSGLSLVGTDGTAYSFSLRPILPDEQF